MRVATLSKRSLGFDAGSIVAIEVTQRRGEQVVEVQITCRRKRRMACSGCGGGCTAFLSAMIPSSGKGSGSRNRHQPHPGALSAGSHCSSPSQPIVIRACSTLYVVHSCCVASGINAEQI